MRKGNVREILFLFNVAIILVVALAASAQQAVPMLINYQGELRDPATGGVIADGAYDMALRIYDAESGGSSLWEGTYTAANGNAVQVANGIFSVILGSGAGNALNTSTFNGPDRWLETEVGGEMLNPRQRITSAAFSIVSENSRLLSGRDASDFAEAAHSHIGDDIVSLPWGKITELPPGFADEEDNDTTYTAGAGLSLLDTQFSVTFDGSGAANTVARSDHHHDGAYASAAHEHDADAIVSGRLDPARFSAYEDLATEGHLDGDAGTDVLTIEHGNARYWALGGNIGTSPDNFLGTSDNQAMEVRVNGGRALRLEPGASPNIIGGYATNRATVGVIGAAVGGGGEAGAANRVTDDFGTVGGGRNNQAGDDAGTTTDRAYASVGGGAGNLSSGMYATVGGGLGNQAMAEYATIAGGGRLDPGNPLLGNSVFDHYGSIGGGGNNRAGSDDGDPTNATYATVGGGGTNWATGQGATVGGGIVNEASGFAATVPGGDWNTASGDYATIGGGAGNEAIGERSTVGGGTANKAQGAYSTIAGGGPSDPTNAATGNRITDSYGTVGGGGNNQAGNDTGTPSDANFATVGGGHSNVAGAFSATVAGGAINEASASWAAIGGGNWNKVTDENGTVAGGNNNQAGDDAGTTDDAKYATVGGGGENTASGLYATVGGGESNAASGYATVGGGSDNIASGWDASVGGGQAHTASGDGATVGGGYHNTASGPAATVSGGEQNSASALNSTVGGGVTNHASEECSTVGGGGWNTASSNAATVGGGAGNTASGFWATVPGGCSNTAEGNYSFAAGWNAKANHAGAFVWGDYQPTDIASTRMNEVTFRCLGGVRFLSGSGGANQMVAWAPGSSSWSFSSDRNLKENFQPVDAEDVLEKVSRLPVAEWNFKGYPLKHIGPMAQDFHALFPLGGSETMIDSGDLQGVALAAIQGLHESLREKGEEISTLKKQNATLEARLAVLEALVETLAKEGKGGEK